MERVFVSRVFGLVGVVVATILFSGCDSGSSKNAEAGLPNTPAVNNGDQFTVIDANGETTRIFEASVSAEDPAPSSYISAKVDYVPTYYWDYDPNSKFEDNEKLITLPSPTLKVEFATDLNPYSGGYEKLYQFIVPGIAPGSYYADEYFSFRFPDGENDYAYYGNIYLDKVTLSEVGNVGEPVKGAYEYWVCDVTCKHYVGEFVATREADIEFKAQGTKSAPMVIAKSPMILRKDLIAKIGEPSYYQIQVQANSYYSFDFDSNWGFFNYSVYGDPAFTNLLCDFNDSCEGIFAIGESIYMKAEVVIGDSATPENQYALFTGSNFSLVAAQVDFASTLATAFDLGRPPMLRQPIYVGMNQTSFYKASIDPDKFYTVALFDSPNFNSYYDGQLSTSTEFGVVDDCSGDNFRNSVCTFLSGPDQTDLIFNLSGYYNSAALFTLTETKFKSVGTAAEPLFVESFQYGNYSVPYFLSEVGNDSSYYKVAVTPQQLYHLDLFDSFDVVDVTVFSDAAFTNSQGSASASSMTSTDVTDPDAHIEFTTAADQTFVYIKVNGAKATKYKGGRFGVSVYPYYKAQGTVDSPVSITGSFGTEFVSSIGNNVNSYYVVTIPANTAVSISLNGMSNFYNISGYAYTGADFSTGQQCYLNSSFGDSCTLYTNADGLTLYIMLNQSSNTSGSPVGITVAPHKFGTVGAIGHPYLAGSEPLMGFYGENDLGSSYLKVRVAANKPHSVRLDSSVDDLNLHVYSDSAYSNLLCKSELARTTTGELEPDTCNFDSPAGGFVYIKISGEMATTYQGSGFNLTVLRIFANEGTSAAPVNLGTVPVGRTPGHVGPTDFSLYQATVAAGSQYQVQVSHANKYVYSEVLSGDVFESASAMCSMSASNYGDTGICRTPNTTSTKLWIKVTDSSGQQTSGATYSLSIVNAGENEGSAGSPIALGAVFPVNRASTVGKSGSSYYTMPVSAGTTYQIDLSNGAPAHLALYTDSSFTTRRACSYPTGITAVSTYCVLTTGGGESVLYIKVYDSVTNANAIGGVFRLNVYNTLPTSQGTSTAPFDLPPVPFTNQALSMVRWYGYSYYRIPVEGATAYTMNFNDANTGVRVEIRSSRNSSLQYDGCSSNSSSATQTCSFVTDPSETFVTIEVQPNYSQVGSYFSMDMFKN